MGRAVRLGALFVLTAYSMALVISSGYVAALFNGTYDHLVLGDFGSFYESGRAGSTGLDPYAVYPLTEDAALGPGRAAINLNAPLSVLAFEPFAALDPGLARELWFGISVLAYAGLLGLLAWRYPHWRRPLPLTWAVASIAFWETIALGQIYTVLGLLTVGAWLLVRRFPVAAGVLMGVLVAIKPNFVVWPILLAIGGYRRAAIAAGASALAFGLAPMLVLQPWVYRRWIEVAATQGINAQVANGSFGGLLVRLGAPQVAATLVMALGLAALAIWAWRCRPPVEVLSGVALVGLLLCSPLAWVGYSVFVLPLFAATAPVWPLIAAAALLLVPRIPLQLLADASDIARVTLGGVYTLAWVLLLYAFVRQARGEPRRS